MSATMTIPQFPTMMPQMIASKRIVSVCPLPRLKTLPIGNHGMFPFHIPAMKRDQYHILEVHDTYTRIKTGFSEETEAGVHLAPAPLPARVIADDLVREWNMSLSNVGSLGLMVLPDDVEEGSDRFKAILQHLTAQVREVAEWAIRQANDMYGKNKSEFITNGFHRALARWLMDETAARAIPWYNAQAVNALKECIACGNSINAKAKVCPSCSTDLLKYFKEYGHVEADDPYIYSFINRVKTPVQTERTASTTGAPPAFRVTLPDSVLPAEARSAVVAVMSGEQKAAMNQMRGQDAKDEYIVKIIPDLCLKNNGLADTLKTKGYVSEG